MGGLSKSCTDLLEKLSEKKSLLKEKKKIQPAVWNLPKGTLHTPPNILVICDLGDGT